MGTESVIINPQGPATASVILLHGLGADGYDLASIVPEIQNSQTRFILPHAPERPITRDKGMVMPGWYDLYEAGIKDEQDSQGLQDSGKIVGEIIAQEMQQGIDSNRIVVGGLSQGGAQALYTALRYPKALAGIMALSSYLPLPETLENERHDVDRQLPVFMGHGIFDLKIIYNYALSCQTVLEELGYRVEIHFYEMGHGIGPEELSDMARWLNIHLPPL